MIGGKQKHKNHHRKATHNLRIFSKDAASALPATKSQQASKASASAEEEDFRSEDWTKKNNLLKSVQHPKSTLKTKWKLRLVTYNNLYNKVFFWIQLQAVLSEKQPVVKPVLQEAVCKAVGIAGILRGNVLVFPGVGPSSARIQPKVF